jgi:hypothetical protein
MSNEERIAVECVLRAYEEMILAMEQDKERYILQPNVYYTGDDRLAKARGKIHGTKECLRDLMNAKI